MTTTDIDNSLILHDLNKEAMVRQLMEKTKENIISWTHLGGNEFSSTNGVWSYFMLKAQIGNFSYKYTLDIRKNNAIYIQLVDGPLNSSSRDSQTKNLYEVIELKTLTLNSKVQEALNAISAIVG